MGVQIVCCHENSLSQIESYGCVQVLDIDLEWRMHQVSDGQRRRVQICVGLLKPFKVREL
jgi:ABC-type uncharacterized transport system ATPase subunit